MADEAREEPAAQNDSVLELNFVPSWARQPPAQAAYRDYEERPPRRGGEHRQRPDDRDRRPRPDGRQRRDGSGKRDRRDRRPGREVPARQAVTPEQPATERFFVKISFIPSRPAIAGLAAAIRQAHRAYPLFELALRLLAKPATHLVILDPMENPSRKGRGTLFQCKNCGRVFLLREELDAHLMRTHFADFFKAETVETDPPKGNFSLVARCRLSGELLGPPNHHSYNQRLLELHSTRFPHMSLDSYRQHIETVRDPALIEKWKDETRKQTVYHMPDKADAPPLKRNEAESMFMEKHVPGMISEVKRAILPAEVAHDLDHPLLRSLVQKAFESEKRNPFGLTMALRPSLRHVGFHFFRTRNRMTFVTPIAPRPLNPDYAIESISEVLKHLDAHPGCKRQELVEHLRPGTPVDAPEAHALLSPLNWLIEKGHVIEFGDGSLSVPRSGNPPPKQASHGKPAPASAATPPAQPNQEGNGNRVQGSGSNGVEHPTPNVQT